MSESPIADDPVDQELAPPDLVARADELVDYCPQAFWGIRINYPTRTVGDVRAIIRLVRHGGDASAGMGAQKLYIDLKSLTGIERA